MKQTRQRFIFLTLSALLVLFAGCKGESPTAPPPITGTNGGTGSGSGTPPVGASLTLTASNTAPFTASTSTLTATVTQNNARCQTVRPSRFVTRQPMRISLDTADNHYDHQTTTTAS
jgi:hypothetical protein